MGHIIHSIYFGMWLWFVCAYGCACTILNCFIIYWIKYLFNSRENKGLWWTSVHIVFNVWFLFLYKFENSIEILLKKRNYFQTQVSVMWHKEISNSPYGFFILTWWYLMKLISLHVLVECRPIINPVRSGCIMWLYIFSSLLASALQMILRFAFTV